MGAHFGCHVRTHDGRILCILRASFDMGPDRPRPRYCLLSWRADGNEGCAYREMRYRHTTLDSRSTVAVGSFLCRRRRRFRPVCITVRFGLCRCSSAATSRRRTPTSSISIGTSLARPAPWITTAAACTRLSGADQGPCQALRSRQSGP